MLKVKGGELGMGDRDGELKTTREHSRSHYKWFINLPLSPSCLFPVPYSLALFRNQTEFL
jgi:hypothetical protein